jgi:hypothetical protein
MFIDSGVFGRAYLSEMLDISKENFDKARGNLLKVLGQQVEVKKRDSYSIKYDCYTMTHNYLTLLYRQYELRQKEIDRFVLILQLLQEHTRCSMDQLNTEIVRHLEAESEEEIFSLERKLLAGYLSELEKSGMIYRVKEGKSWWYYLADEIWKKLNESELEDLYDFVDFCANTMVPSSVGYLMRDTIEALLRSTKKLGENQLIPVQIYTYNQFGKILDEYAAYELMEAIQKRQMVSLQYHSVSSKIKRMAKMPAENRLRVVPLKIVYDHYYAAD